MPLPKQFNILASAALIAALSIAPGLSENTQEVQKGFDIAARSDRSDVGFGNSRSSAKMILRNSAGQEAIREMSFRTLEKVSEQVGDKSLVIFESPRDVKGTALLSHAQILKPDDQWLFLPALKRVKRISSTNKSGPFVGSEFAFEDFTITELGKFSYKYLHEEDINGMTMDVIERIPQYENSGYTRQIAWIDQDSFQTRKVQIYDRKNSLLKTLTLQDYRNYDGVWRPHTLTMVNHQNNKSTNLVYGEYKFKTGLAEKDFVKGVLERIR